METLLNEIEQKQIEIFRILSKEDNYKLLKDFEYIKRIHTNDFNNTNNIETLLREFVVRNMFGEIIRIGYELEYPTKSQTKVILQMRKDGYIINDDFCKYFDLESTDVVIEKLHDYLTQNMK